MTYPVTGEAVCKCGVRAWNAKEEDTEFTCADCHRTERIIEKLERIESSIDSLWDLINARGS